MLLIHFYLCFLLNLQVSSVVCIVNFLLASSFKLLVSFIGFLETLGLRRSDVSKFDSKEKVKISEFVC